VPEIKCFTALQHCPTHLSELEASLDAPAVSPHKINSRGPIKSAHTLHKEAILFNSHHPEEKKGPEDKLVPGLELLPIHLESAVWLYERAAAERLENPLADVTATFYEYQLAAEAGSLSAHYYLGCCYETGRGVVANPSYALRCFQEARGHHPKAEAAYQRLLSTSPLALRPVSSVPTLKTAEFKRTVQNKLGEGGQGAIYQDQLQGEAVIIKYFFSVPITDIQRQVAHLVEAKTNHSAYLMQIKAVCLQPLCVVLEYMPGKNLKDFLKAYPDMTWLRRYRLAHDIIQGLAYLHQQSLLHRDLKSANIMVMEQPRIHTKLCDFDSIKKVQAGETGSTGDKATPPYSDPEFVCAMYSKSPMSYAWPHDIYSLGWVLWELATGEGACPVQIHENVIYTLKKDERLIDTIPNHCPAHFAQLIRDCWGYPSALRPSATKLAQQIVFLLQTERQTFANQPDEKGHTPLMKAIFSGKAGRVATLLDCKASVDQTGTGNLTPLLLAVQQDKRACRLTQVLLDVKADFASVERRLKMLSQAVWGGDEKETNQFLEEGFSPHTEIIDSETGYSVSLLYAAAKAGHRLIIKRLLEHSANIHRGKKDGATPLYGAAVNGQIETAKLLLDSKAAVDKARIDGWTPLLIAVQNDHTDTAKLLLDSKAEVNKAKTDGATPLFVAAEKGQTETAKLLLDSKAEIDKARTDGAMPLLIAVEKGQTETAKLLLDSKAAVDQAMNDGATPLFISAQKGQTDTTKLLLESKAEVNKAKTDGATPLLIAAQNGQTSTAKFLLESKAEVDKAMSDGRAPLYIAALQGHIEIAKLLLDSKAAVDKAMTGSWTPLMEAAENGYTKIAKLLLDAKAGVDKADSKGQTSLIFAAHKGQTETARLLLDSKAEVDKARIDGVTPLYLAAANGHTGTAQLLLDSKAEIDKAMNNGATPLYKAAANGQTETAKLLLDSKAAVGQAMNDGATPLLIAAYKGHTDTAKLLLDSKAEVDQAVTNGETPLYVAAQEGQTKVAKLLLEANANVNKKPGWIFGCTSLEIAEEKGHTSVAEAIKQWSQYGRFFPPVTMAPVLTSEMEKIVKENKYTA
jgi:ankyrin repeat protein